MNSLSCDGIHRIGATDELLRVSRDSAEKSREYLRRSQDLVLRSKTLLAQSGPIVQDVPIKNLLEPAPARPLITSSPKSESLQVVSGRTIQGEVVNMDGKHFVDCEILNCTLQYSGQAIILESTRFDDCNFQFSDEAALTMRFLECFQLLPENSASYTNAKPAAGAMRLN